MNNKQVERMLAIVTDTSDYQAKFVLSMLAFIIQDALRRGDNVQIDNIGTFHVMDSNNMNDKKRVKLKAHAALKAAINEELNE